MNTSVRSSTKQGRRSCLSPTWRPPRSITRSTPIRPEDLCKLGLLYSTGQCGEVDFIEAHKWFNLAALMGSEPAKHYRSEVAGEMDGEQLAAALSAAREWLSTRH